ncbi:acyltransferase [Candidatus Oleimmundimicrobium sp.]|uniref:acyltransferase n=1 Tax=Candidatus Oleimmundimicrobium sp. TaxID=3060597 RepID=UPI002725DE95|nr:acyltransferase [Candidatus Oleimmundimicrobium sp.]MDO8885568.1 acyltransferase [Candidatus Oleimmundimicrobium sp.]
MANCSIAASAKTGSNFKTGQNVVIYEDVKIGSNVILGNNVIIYEGVQIGDNVTIADNAVLGRQPKLAPTSTAKVEGRLSPLEIGSGCSIGTGAIIYAGTKLGENVTVADLATIREKVVIGDFVVVGRGVAIENEVSIGDYTKMQTNSYITAYSILEDHVFIAPMVTFTNDNYMGRTEKRLKEMKGAHVKRGARIGGNSILLPAIEVGEESFIAAGSIVTKDVPAYKLVMGIPARVVRDVPEEELLKNQ